ncbi:HNH endonuclease [Arthrobacter sp. 1P04PC]|uniref:HNH endonuclease n=1 Tax=unclassified Arthrobacter TaxID=235627 RepID=UPI00399F8ECB
MAFANNVPAVERFWASVDDTAECWEWTGRKNTKGYGALCVSGKQVKAHRFSYETYVGPIPAGAQIDHRCHNKACVKPAHLRLASHKQNRENLIGAQRNNHSSGVRGVYWKTDVGKWHAVVRHANRSYNVGYFTDLREAEKAVVAKRNELYTHNDTDRKAS